MRQIEQHIEVNDLDGGVWAIRVLGPDDAGRSPDQVMSICYWGDDPDHPWYGSDPVRFPLEALSKLGLGT